jgi:aspartate beta-hydroxylase
MIVFVNTRTYILQMSSPALATPVPQSNPQSNYIEQAHASLRAGRIGEAAATLRRLLEDEPANVLGWCALGDALEHAGLEHDAIRARAKGLRHGRAVGYFRNMETTPELLRPRIVALIGDVNRQLFDTVGQGLDQVHAAWGPAAMRRVAHAMNVFVGRAQDGPRSAHQAPKFLFFPGLPEGPWHDPALHPWSARLVGAWDRIRAEALAVLQDDGALEDFLRFEPGQSRKGYLGGAGAKPAWDAFFFYRHGQRYGDNHARCPQTSALLDEIELCEVAGQAPEICFSVLQPGTHIMPHHGVTNTRLVYHLPLVVPGDCALKVHGGGEHRWREREPMMFDDTFLHEAWNRSAQPRVILLMDCWNPHLTPEERGAVRVLVELISAYENFGAHDFDRVMRQLGG